LTGLWIKEEMKAQRTVVFVPSIALLRQTWSIWNRHANETATGASWGSMNITVDTLPCGSATQWLCVQEL
jgi:predicted helicase